MNHLEAMSSESKIRVKILKKDRLLGKLVKVKSLSARDRDEMWTLLDTYYEGVSRATFESDLAKKSDLILMRSEQSGEVKGFCTLVAKVFETKGRRWKMVFTGDTIIDQGYWGQQTLHRCFMQYLIRQKLSHPLLPLHWLLITKGFKTYLTLTRNFLDHWPRHDRETPAWESSAIHHAATELFGEEYDPVQGIIRYQEAPRLKEWVAPEESVRGHHSDIEFFFKLNPNHHEGEELVCLGAFSLSYLYHHFTRTLRKHLKRSRSTQH